MNSFNFNDLKFEIWKWESDIALSSTMVAMTLNEGYCVSRLHKTPEFPEGFLFTKAVEMRQGSVISFYISTRDLFNILYGGMVNIDINWHKESHKEIPFLLREYYNKYCPIPKEQRKKPFTPETDYTKIREGWSESFSNTYFGFGPTKANYRPGCQYPEEIKKALIVLELDINQHPTKQQLNVQKRELLRKYHPDTNKDAMAETISKNVNESYVILCKYFKL